LIRKRRKAVHAADAVAFPGEAAIRPELLRGQRRCKLFSVRDPSDERAGHHSMETRLIVALEADDAISSESKQLK